MKRVLLKLSGEALSGQKGHGFEEATVRRVAEQIKKVTEAGTQVGIVIGGGNFWRGRDSETISRERADQIGMLATVMNAVYVSEICRFLGMGTEIFTPFACAGFSKLYDRDAVEEAFAAGKLVFFAGGTGHPYFSTDTATVLRAIQIGAEVILLAKAVDGIYNADPKKDPNAKRYDTISISQVVADGLEAMDLSASIMCKQYKIPMFVFALEEEDSILHAASGNFTGTRVTVE